MKEYICNHCGGHILPRSMKCEYCGIQYKVENDNILRIETYQNPVETFTAVEVIPMKTIDVLGAETAGEMALRHLTHKLSDCIAPMMRVDTEYDYMNCSQRIRATVKIVRPVKN